MKQIMRRPKYAFTLIELLVVIAIISIIAAILFPVFAQAREKARETTCISNLRQIGLGVRAYIQDYDETFPIFQAYNAVSGGAPGQPGHKGVEDEIAPYIKSTDIFKCPDDAGGAPASGIKGTYFEAFGSSYRFTKSCYTLVPGKEGSLEDDIMVDPQPTQVIIVRDSMYETPATTRIMRDEMFPWFSSQMDPTSKYGYGPWYMQWHPRGGGMVFADGHSKFISNVKAFNEVAGNPQGDPFPTCWWGCD